MPKLWTNAVETHRRAVRDAALETAAALVAKQGLRSVTMAQIAEEAGIGRATLYKYFPDVESMLAAWHERQVSQHLEQLEELRKREGSPLGRLEAVLQAYASIQHGLRAAHATELAVHLHRKDHVQHAQQRLKDFIQGLLSEGARAGEVRRDIPPEELASFCLHALAAAGTLASKSALRRLVALTLAGVRPPQ